MPFFFWEDGRYNHLDNEPQFILLHYFKLVTQWQLKNGWQRGQFWRQGGGDNGGGNGSSGGSGLSKGGGNGGAGGGHMKAPGDDGSYISRAGFKANPQLYISGLHGSQRDKWTFTLNKMLEFFK